MALSRHCRDALSGAVRGGDDGAARFQPARVLVVEDEFLISEMMVEALAEQGFEVHAAANAEDALRHLARGEPCDVLFTDINLAGGIDGAALSRSARELRPGLPVVYASGAVGDRATAGGAGRDLRAQALRSGQGLLDAAPDRGAAPASAADQARCSRSAAHRSMPPSARNRSSQWM